MSLAICSQYTDSYCRGEVGSFVDCKLSGGRRSWTNISSSRLCYSW